MKNNEKKLEYQIRTQIKETLALDNPRDATPGVLTESYVTEPKNFQLTTELLSSKTKKARQELFENYVASLNRVSAELDAANREEANSGDSSFRSLKVDETYNLNASFLSALYMDNISDPQSQLLMDSLTFMRLERDFGTFDEWQKDFIACALSARNGWALTVYNTFLNRYMNVVVDLHSTHVPIAAYPVIALDMWENAYYRDYLNDKKSYIFAMMKEFDWETIDTRFKKAERMAKALK
jgi:Fe-Mn family superoxide dismutase